MRKTLSLTWLLIFFVYSAGAQTPSTTQKKPQTSANDLRMLKIQMATLMFEKKQMEEENILLKQQYAKVKKVFAEQMREVIAVNPKILTDEKYRYAHEQWIDKLGEELDDLEDEYLIGKFKNAYMQRALIDETQMTTVRRLHLADLSYQKRDLELQLKWAKYEQEEVAVARNEELARLKRRYQKSLELEQKLASELKAVEDGTFDVEVDKSKLENENQSLKENLYQLQGQLKKQQQSQPLLGHKKDDALQAQMKEIAAKEAEVARLEAMVSGMQDQRQSLAVTIQESLARTNVLRALTEQMVILDRENQELRNKISDLESKTSQLSN